MLSDPKLVAHLMFAHKTEMISAINKFKREYDEIVNVIASDNNQVDIANIIDRVSSIRSTMPAYDPNQSLSMPTPRDGFDQEGEVNSLS